MLRLSREADYSLLAMIYIASQPASHLAHRRDIAAHYNIPREFLAKVLQKLSRHGLVKSFRGMQGGYRLARDPRSITLSDVIEAVDGPLALVDCQCPSRDCEQEPACTIKLVMGSVQHQVKAIFSDLTLHEMCRRRGEGGARLAAAREATR